MSAYPRLLQIVACEAPRSADFAALTEVCEGAWPGEIKRALEACEGQDAQRLLLSVGDGFRRVRSDHRLPLAHPLDADWRFTRECAERVLDHLLQATPAAGDILLIAMPTVALAAHDRGMAHRIVIASRPDDPIDEALRTVMPDCRFQPIGQIGSVEFPTVALDPPWYDDVALPLLSIARDATGEGGKLFACLPDALTSPSSAQGLSALAETPPSLGFRSSSLVERVRYETPFFEVRCLEASGITNISPTWRTGQLYACTPRARSTSRQTRNYVDRRGWREVRFGPIRIWLRRSPSRDDALPIISIARSISRADRARDIASLWTSGNTFATNVDVPDAALIERVFSDLADRPWQHRLRAAISQERSALERAVDFV